MKHVLLTFIIIVFTSHFSRAQNDMKARIEYEDAELAFQNKDYRKAITHLDNAEKFLNKWTPKVSYLKINALDHLTDYENPWDEQIAELYRQVKEYMGYAGKNSDKVDLDKVREIYAVEKRVDFAKKKKEFVEDPDYIKSTEAFKNSDFKQAMDFSLSAANKNNTRAMSNLYQLFIQGKGTEVDYKKAMEWLSKSSKQGDPLASFRMGDIYLFGEGDITKDYKEALRYFEIGADYGIGNALVRIGYMYEMGLGVTSDYREAINWYQKAVDKGNALGMFHMGHLYYEGKTVEKNYQEALNWFKKAGNKGYGISMGFVGNMYFYGQGISVDYQEALNWYSKTLESGISEETKNAIYVGMAACNFQLTNYTQSMEWYLKAYETGKSEIAKGMVARMYDEGLGVKKDKRKAKEWQNK